jgi:hypothetical protein
MGPIRLVALESTLFNKMAATADDVTTAQGAEAIILVQTRLPAHL